MGRKVGSSWKGEGGKESEGSVKGWHGMGKVCGGVAGVTWHGTGMAAGSSPTAPLTIRKESKLNQTVLVQINLLEGGEGMGAGRNSEA